MLALELQNSVPGDLSSAKSWAKRIYRCPAKATQLQVQRVPFWRRTAEYEAARKALRALFASTGCRGVVWSGENLQTLVVYREDLIKCRSVGIARYLERS
jgi:hypothetical protein